MRRRSVSMRCDCHANAEPEHQFRRGARRSFATNWTLKSQECSRSSRRLRRSRCALCADRRRRRRRRSSRPARCGCWCRSRRAGRPTWWRASSPTCCRRAGAASRSWSRTGPGAGTIVMTTAVAKAPPDGHTLGVATNSLLINPAIGMKLPYDTFREIAGVSMIATQPVALVANKAFPANSLAEVVELAKKAPEPLNYTSPGPRGVGHLAGELLQQKAGIRMTHINYNGSAPALTDVIAGRVPLMFDIWHSARRYVDSGDLKLIAGAGPDPLPGAESVPVIDKTYPGFTVVAFNAVIAPAGNAAGGAGEALRRRARGRDLAGLRGAHPRARHQCVGHDAEGARRLVRERNREMGRDRQGREPEGRVNDRHQGDRLRRPSDDHGHPAAAAASGGLLARLGGGARHRLARDPRPIRRTPRSPRGRIFAARTATRRPRAAELAAQVLDQMGREPRDPAIASMACSSSTTRTWRAPSTAR